MFNINNRKVFYKKKFGKFCHKSGMVVELPIRKDLFKSSQLIIKKIFEKSYFHTYGKKVEFEDILKKKKIELLNKTPNGLLTIQNEISAEYGILHEVYTDILTSLKLDKVISKIHFPLALRLTNKFTRKVATRKKSINTPHSDLWVGHDIDATIWLPFFGNLSSSGINFFEPKKITNKFSMTYNSFKEATKNSFFKIKQFHPRLKLGNLYLFDAYCLHGTMQKNNTSYRVSFDSYFRFKKRLPGFKRTSDKKLDSFYIDLKKYSEIGYTKYLNSNMNFLKTKKVFLSKNKKIINPHTFAKLVN